MADIKGITIQIEGKTSGLVSSLKDVESQLKKDDAALKDLEKQLQLDPSNVELLAAKEALLAEKTELASKKMDILKQVAEDAMGDLPEESKLTAAQQAELAAEIAKTEQQLKGEKQESEETSVSLEGLGKAAEAAGKVAEVSFKAMATTIAAVSAAAVAAAAAIGTAFAKIGSSLVTATINTSQLADELITLSSTTGLATSTIQELNYAQELLDVSTDTVTGSMTKLLTNMDKAADGSESAQASFASLGISYKDAAGNLRSTEDVFWDAIDALGKIENETERDAVAMDLFGKSAKELNPLIEAGSEEFAKLAEEARETGYVMSDETLAAFGALDDNVQKLKNGVQSVEQSFGKVLLPLLTDLSGEGVDLLQGFSKELATCGTDISKIGNVIEEYAPKVVSVVKDFVPQVLTIVEDVINALLPAITAVLPSLISTIGSIVTQLANSVAQNSQSFIDAFNSLFEALANSLNSILPTILPIAINLVVTLANGIIANLPTLIDAAVGIVDTLCNALLRGDNVSKLANGAVRLLTQLVSSFVNNLPVIVSAAAQIAIALVQGLADNMGTLIPQIAQAFLTIVQTLTSPDVLGPLLSAILDLVIAICDGLMNSMDEIGLAIVTIIANVIIVLGEHLPEIIEFIVTTTVQGLGALFNLIIGMFGGHIEDIFGNFTDIAKFISDWFTTLIGNVLTWFVDLSAKFTDFVTNVGTKIGEGVASIWEKVTGLWTNITTGFSSFFTNLFNGIVTLATNIVNKVIEIKDAITNKFKDLVSGAFNWGKDLIQNIIDGIKSMISNVTNAVKSVADAIASYLHFSVPDKGPLSDFDESGADMIDEFIKSMKTQRAALSAALTDTSSLISDEMNDISFDSATISPSMKQDVTYQSNFDKLLNAVNASVRSQNLDSTQGQIVIPVYIGNELIDTMVVNAFDRYNYATGGH